MKGAIQIPQRSKLSIRTILGRFNYIRREPISVAGTISQINGLIKLTPIGESTLGSFKAVSQTFYSPRGSVLRTSVALLNSRSHILET